MPRWALAAFGLYGVVLLLLVLWPAPQRPDEPVHALRFAEGAWLADGLRNVVLFAPMGLGLRLAGVPLGRIGWVGLAVSLAIEAAQLFVPGRFTSPLDLATNAAGAALGGALPGLGAALRRETVDRPDRLAVGAGLASVAALVATSLLAAPKLPGVDAYGGWTPDYGVLERYRGEVMAARVGDVPIPPAGPTRQSAALRRGLLDQAEVGVAMRAGPAPASLSQIVSVVDGMGNELVLVGADGPDLIFSVAAWAESAGLHRDWTRFRGALQGVAPGDELELAIRPDGASVALWIDGRLVGRERRSLARGWTVFVWPQLATSGLRGVGDVAWLALVFGPVTFFAARRRATWALVPALALFVAGWASVGWLGPLTAAQWLSAGGVVAVAATVSLVLQRRADAASTRR